MERLDKSSSDSGPGRGRRQAPVWRRRLILGAAGGGALSVMAACGTGGTAAPSGGSTPAAGAGATRPAGSTQPVRFMWQIRDSPTYLSLAEWGVQQFKQRFPQATIELSADSTGNFEKTVALMVSGTGPDVFHGWGQLLQQYAGKGVMFNHNELLKAEKDFKTDDFIDYQWKGFVVPSTDFRFGLPTYVNIFLLYYNKSLLQQRGAREPTADLTYESYADWLKQLTFSEGDKRVWGGFQNAVVFDRQYHAWAFGGNYVDPRDLTKSLLGDEKTLQAVEWQRARLFQDQSWAPVDASRRPWTPNSQFDGFFQGVLASIEDGMHAFERVARGMQSTGSEWGIMHFPKGPARRATLGTTDGWALWRETKAKDAAWELMKFLTTSEWYEQQVKMEGLIPSRKSVLETWVNTMKEKWPQATGVDYKVVIDALTTMNYAQNDLAFLCQAEAMQVVDPALKAVLQNGDQPASYLRDIRGQVEQAAGSCGFKFS
ncbi:MAG TPA: extracellular solute-binding protein [Chloroflexota bacterium]|jgi:multiple sugar transport system substrate-binding protein|nr:extracellular solute-binding protein [Chloroflexota bacterium]